jgi:pyridoxamine 5'-phosphate oxidase
VGLTEIRAELQTAGVHRADFSDDPFVQFENWYAFAFGSGLYQPDAMALATATPDGRPSVRQVLLKDVEGGALVFFTNYHSAKAADLGENPLAAVVFGWHELGRQVRASGRVAKLRPDQSDDYFATRPRASQLGAWASVQSEIIDHRANLEARVAELAERWEATTVQRPPFWGGYRLVVDEFEFWQGRADRLHDRFRYLREPPTDTWRIDRLSP